MNIEDLLRQATTGPLTLWEEATVGKNLRRVEQDYQECRDAGCDPIDGVDLADPLRDTHDEATRIARQAELAGLGTFTWDARTGTLHWSAEMARITGYPRRPTSGSVDRHLDCVHPDDRDRVAEAMRRTWDSTSIKEVEHRMVGDDGEIRYLRCFLEVLLGADNEPAGLIGTAQDVTESVLYKRELERVNRRLETVIAVVGESLADRDPHTGLFNRRRFVTELDRATKVGAGALLLLELAGLTDVNRTHGPQVGDDLLQTVATTLRNVTGPDAILARVGGAEFAILMPDTPSDLARRAAEELLDVVQTPYLIAGHLRLNGRIGLVEYSSGQVESGEDLLIDADLAAYDAKEEGCTIAVADGPATIAERRSHWQERVRRAIGRDRFSLYTQPILDLSRNRVTRHELLLRLTERNELVTPASFLPTAERLGAIGEIDRFVVQNAIGLLTHTETMIGLQVNLSGRSVAEEHIGAVIEGLIFEHRVDPRRLTFEITETALIGNITAARAFADQVRDLGCQLALDDFGSGYASLTYLKYLPFDMVKIDGELVKNLRRDKGDQVIVHRISQMCADLGIATVAEYVEDGETLARLREYGVNYAQGYEIGRPRPTAELLATPGETAHRSA